MRASQNDALDTRTALALAAFAIGFGALGVLGVASRDFAFQWQPVPPDVPARATLAIVAGMLEIVAAVSHFVYAEFTASMIPAWLPQRVALAYVTGAAHALAGLAIASGIRRTLAATLEAAMMASFVALVHAPRVLAHPDSRMEWTMLFVALTLSGSAALVAALSRRGA